MRELKLTTPRDAYARPARTCPGRFWRRAATRRVAAFIVMSVFGLLCIQSAKAQTIPLKCLQMQPNAKRLLDAGRVAVEGVTSNDDYSRTPGCDFYVMEIAVPASSTPPMGFRPSFDFQIGAAEEDEEFYWQPKRCLTYRQESWVVKKSVANNQMMGPGGFKRVAWKSMRCDFLEDPKSVWESHPLKYWVRVAYSGGKKTLSFDPPTSGTDIYRVGIKIRTGDNGIQSTEHVRYWKVRIKVARRGQQIADPTGTQHSK